MKQKKKPVLNSCVDNKDHSLTILQLKQANYF